MSKPEIDVEYCQTLRCIDWAIEKKKKIKDKRHIEPEIEEVLPPKL
jgi:hypothetical protein